MSEAVTESMLGVMLNSKLERIGNVWRRSTLPLTHCKHGNKSDLLILKFIYIPLLLLLLANARS